MPFCFKQMEIPGVVLITPEVHKDDRGYFIETYKQSEFKAAGIHDEFVQENQSKSLQRILRGLHYQRPPRAQGKLVRVLSGEIFDVAVDIRKESATHGKWVGVSLSAENCQLLYIPPWCAHGFCVLSENALVLYKTTQEYSPAHETGIAWNDATLGIQWPVLDPVLSERDQHWPPFESAKISRFLV